jgi:hypothetical protein
MRLLVTMLVFSLGFISSCKPNVQQPHSQGDLKTLDNFVAGENVVVNQCKGVYKFDQIDPVVKKFIAEEHLIEVAENLRSVVDATLTAVPTSLKNLFFSLGYRIEVGQGYAAHCQKLTGNPLDRACVQSERSTIEDPNTGERFDVESLSIIVEASSKDIRHGLLRAFGYLMSERFAKLKVDENGKPVYENDDSPSFKDWKSQLAGRLIHDVANSKEGITSKTFGRYRNLLPKDGNLIKRSPSLSVYLKAWNDYERVQPERAHTLATYLLAEAVDSYWCDESKTRLVMKNQFGETYKFFHESLASELEHGWTQSSEAHSSVSANESMALWGGGFPILRGAFQGGRAVVRGAGRLAVGAGRAVVRGGYLAGRAVVQGGAAIVSAPFRARANLVSRVGSYPRLRTGRLFPRAWGY